MGLCPLLLSALLSDIISDIIKLMPEQNLHESIRVLVFALFLWRFSFPLALAIFPLPLPQVSLCHGARKLMDTFHLGSNILRFLKSLLCASASLRFSGYKGCWALVEIYFPRCI